MAKSFRNGDYRLIMAIESSSRPDSWYPVLLNPDTRQVQCTCPAWVFNHRGDRTCQHTDVAERLMANTPNDGAGTTLSTHRAVTDHPLIGATKTQWGGLAHLPFEIEEVDAPIGGKDYHFVLLRTTVGGVVVSGTVAFARKHGMSVARLIPGVTGWAGWAIAAELVRRAGMPLAVGAPPDYASPNRGKTTTTTPRRVALRDLLTVGDQTELGDGLTPAQRAENTLRLFVGDELYQRLERQGYLDVPSTLYSERQRVYRMRRDPHKQSARRLRVFEYGEYRHDYCVVPTTDVPEADHFLTVFLQLCSAESLVLRVVQNYNIFDPNSDGAERESHPPVWGRLNGIATPATILA